MLKKTVLLALAVGALVALAVPAGASGQLLTESGSALGFGANVLVVSANTKTTTAAGAFECAKTNMNATVFSNSSSFSELLPWSISATSCSLNQTAGGKSHIPMTTESAALANVSLNIAGTGTTTGMTFVANISGILKCHFTGSPGISYVTNTDSIHLEGGLSSASPGCPATALIEGDFTLETSTGTLITID